MTIRVIDTETTGTDPAKDKVVEIAAVDITKVSDKYTPINVRSHLINPGMPIPPNASAVHHIIDADVAGCPTLDDVMPAYAQHHDERLICVAHNAAFEIGFLTAAFNECETAPEWLCTYKAALRVWPDLPSHSNQFLRYHLGFAEPFGMARDGIAAHRALGDCYVTGCILLALLQRAKLSDMLAWTQEPALYSRFSFGKHKGKRYDEVPADYLDWIVRKSDMEADVKGSAKYWLEKPKAAVAGAP